MRGARSDLQFANRDRAAFGRDTDRFNPYRPAKQGVRPYRLAFSAGRHVCIGRPLVTTVTGKQEPGRLTDGSLVRILRCLYEHGLEVDTQRPPVAAETVEDRYAEFPVRFATLANRR